MFDANYQGLMPAGWLQNYFDIIQAANSLETEIIYQYSREYHFKPKFGRKTRIISLRGKNNILYKYERVY